MPGREFHTLVEGGGWRIRASRFAFQTGIGAVSVSLVWCYLTSVEWIPERIDLLPLVLFGVALPWLAVPIPAHIISFATASGRFLMAVSILLALLAVAVSLGRLIFSWDQALVILLAGLITSVGVLAQTLWGRLWNATASDSGVIWRDGILTYGGWMVGIAAAAVIGSFAQPNSGLWFGAAALSVSGWLIKVVPRKSSSANWLSNRSALRLFAAIENAFRRSESRMILLSVFWFAGASLSLLGMVSGGWTSGSGKTLTGGVTGDTVFPELAVVLLALVGGLALGSSPKFVGLRQAWPRLNLAVLCLAPPALALGITLLPGPFKVLIALILGTGFGAAMETASRNFRKSLGAVFVAESEVLLWTAAGGGGIFFCGCFWLAHAMVGFGFVLLVVEILLFGGFALMGSHPWTVLADEEENQSVFDPWYPGKFGIFANEAGEARLISIDYEVSEERREAFVEAIRELAHLRQRQGALFWSLAESADRPENLREQFIVESLPAYGEAVRSETREERQIKQRVFDLNRWDSLPCESRRRLLEA